MNSDDIARLANVSRTTVSKVLNGRGKVSEKTKNKIQQVIQSTGYAPNTAARSLVGKKSKLIALFIIDLDSKDSSDPPVIMGSPFYSEYILHALGISNQLGYDMVISIITQDNLYDIERLFAEKTISGAIIMGDTLSKERLDLLNKRKYNIVFYNEFAKSSAPNMIVVNYNDFKCGQVAGEALVSHGHRHIGIIAGSPNKISPSTRVSGIRDVIEKAGIDFNKECRIAYGKYHRISGGYKAAKSLFSLPDEFRPTAICATSSIMMMGAVDYILENNLSIPKDVSVIGIDGITNFRNIYTACTEIKISVELVAKETVNRLVELICSEKLERNEFLVDSIELILHDSILQLNE